MQGINKYTSRNTEYTYFFGSHTMTTILEKLTEFFKSNEQSRLEQYINSKNPTNAAEVDYWTKEYEYNQQFQWGRGL